MIVLHEIVSTVEFNDTSDAWDYGVTEYTQQDNGDFDETVLVSGEAASYEDALTNVLTKLGNLRRPTI